MMLRSRCKQIATGRTATRFGIKRLRNRGLWGHDGFGTSACVPKRGGVEWRDRSR
jgi:hypothetical protein